MKVAVWSEALVGGQTGTKTMLDNIARIWIRDHARDVAITFVVNSLDEASIIRRTFPKGNWQTKVFSGRKWPLRLAWLFGLKSITDDIGPHDIYLSGWHWPLGRRDRPFVGIVHDLRPLDPKWFDHTLSPLRRRIWRSLYRLSARRCLATAAALVTPSEFTLRHVSENGLHPRQPVRIIPHGVDHKTWYKSLDPTDLSTVLKRIGLPDGSHYVLTIGPHAPHKNMARLVEAFATGPALSDPKAHLLLAGAENVETPKIQKMIRAEGLQGRVHVLGRVPFKDLLALMKGARVFAFVSLFEGFGIPVAEAFAAGVPVVTSDNTSLKEVAGDAALTVDPRDTNAISAALSRFWNDEGLRKAYRERARARVAELNWSVAAQAYLELFRAIHEEPT